MKIKDIVIVCCIVFIVAVGLVIPVSMELSSKHKGLESKIEQATKSLEKNYLELEKQVNWDRSVLETTSEWIYDDISELKKSVAINFVDIVQKSIKSVVHVDCPQWQGSGFIVDKHIVATGRHVVEGVEDFTITLYDGKEYKGTRAISDKKHDVGFIWIEEELPNVVELGSIKDCSLGQDVYVIGSPYGKINFNSLTKGIISGLDRNFDFEDWSGNGYGWEVSFTTDAAGHPGNSGCAVFTMDGKVRGILVGGFSPVLIICMPVDLFLPDLDEIKLMFLMDKYQKEEEEKEIEVIYIQKKETIFDIIGNIINGIIGLIPGVK